MVSYSSKPKERNSVSAKIPGPLSVSLRLSYGISKITFLRQESFSTIAVEITKACYYTPA